jgi:hypothetical protein
MSTQINRSQLGIIYHLSCLLFLGLIFLVLSLFIF